MSTTQHHSGPDGALDTFIQADGKDPVPCTLPLPADVGTLVVRASGNVATIGTLVVQPVTKMRYEGTPATTEIRGVNMGHYGLETDPDPTGITAVEFRGFENVVTIGDYFLQDHKAISSLNLAQMGPLTAIGTYFMTGCAALTSLEVNPLCNVTIVGDRFMMGCKSIATINIDMLKSVTVIGDQFLMSCTALKSINLIPLQNVTSIGDRFMFACSSLAAIDLAPLSKVTGLGCRFMWRCTSLKNVDISPLKAVTKVDGVGFMEGIASIVVKDKDGGGNVQPFSPSMTEVLSNHPGVSTTSSSCICA